MTYTTLQVLLAITAAALSFSVAIYGLVTAPRGFLHRIFAIAMVLLALMQLGAGLSVQSVYWERLRLLASVGLPGFGLLFSVGFARLHPREHVRACESMAVGNWSQLGVATRVGHRRAHAFTTIELGWIRVLYTNFGQCHGNARRVRKNVAGLYR
ncbi:hypothetical protein C2W62_41420 [Candidatus Entotheonella serta]|nr:hypothetical protein C2W62_41420 [Candidatus Entotheonella serta]